MAVDKNRINAPNIIFCEGIDAYFFMIFFLDYLCKKDDFYERFDVKDFGGVTELPRKLKVLLKMPEFDTVQSILVIRDAETSCSDAKREIAKAFASVGFQTPQRPGGISEIHGIKVSYLLFPSLDSNGEENGTLEDLCLKLCDVEDKERIVEDINQFLCTQAELHKFEYPRIHKNRIHMLFSLHDKYVGSKIGEAGKIGLYDWDSELLDYLKSTMRNIAQDD